MAIEWRDSTYGGRDGYAGPIHLFTVSWGLIRKDGKPWVLTCTLPGYGSKRWECTDIDAAAALADRLWARWQELVSAAPAASATTSEGTT